MLSEIFLAKRGWTAWLCGALVIHLCNSGLAFGMSFLNRLFIDALQYHNREGFALYATAYLLCFSVTAPLSAWMRYSKQRAALEWRAQVSAAAYPYARRSDLDNTAERIQSDIATATEGALDLFLTACMSLIEAVAFAILLYSIAPRLLGVLVIYVLLGTWAIHWMGRGLSAAKGRQIRLEADFRRGLLEQPQLLFEGVYLNMLGMLGVERRVEATRSAYLSLPLILPLVILSPEAFSGEISFGTCLQAQGAFYHVMHAGSLIISKYEDLSHWQAAYSRVKELFQVPYQPTPDVALQSKLSSFMER